MAKNSPSMEEWRKLYDAAIEFKKAQCWNWMSESDIFGVKDPETGVIAYCSIMGNMGKFFALAAHLGAEGLKNILDMVTSEDDYFDDPEIGFNQKCLMVSFEDRDMLSREDRAVIRELGLKFRGRNEWPLFRNHTPGLFPWYIDSRECRFLVQVLEQAVQVALRCRLKGKEFLYDKTSGALLTRVSRKCPDGVVWEDSYIKPEPITPKYVSFKLTDELSLHRLSKLNRNKSISWEIDTFFYPMPLNDNGKRPYFPRACLVVDANNGMIVTLEMVRSIETEGYVLVDRLLKLIENYRFIPARIYVQRYETYYFLKELAQQLGIKLMMTSGLSALNEARFSLYEYLAEKE